MKKSVLIFGAISGIIVIAMFVITWPLYKSGALKMENGELIGYTTMVIAFSTIFIAVKSYRDRQLNGTISFGKAFQMGLLITVVASLVYAISWEIYFNAFIPDFMDQYAEMCVTKAKAQGADATKLKAVIDQVEQAKEIYKNPFLRFGFTMIEIFPVGLVIALVSAAILRKKQILPA